MGNNASLISMFSSHLFLIQHLLLEFLSQLRLLIYLIILQVDSTEREKERDRINLTNVSMKKILMIL